MPRPMGTIRILFSSRVLLDLEEADKVFHEKGVKEYTDYVRARGDYKKEFNEAVGGRMFNKGPLWNFAVAAKSLNDSIKGGDPAIEVGVFCKDDSQSALPIFRNLDVQGLGEVEFRMATAGNALVMADHKSFGTDLLLTRSGSDAQFAVDNGIAAAQINFPPHDNGYERKPGQAIRLWVDGDAVAFGSSSELVYRRDGLAPYKKHEADNFAKPVEPGPFTRVLAKISQLNATFPREKQPF